MKIKTRKVDVEIKNGDEIVFQKKDFVIPVGWSDRAATIVASKYAMDSENSAVDIIDRVVQQITQWGVDQKYFRTSTAELKDVEFGTALRDILLNQRAAFNSPVWFNCGSDTGTNQMSACFIVPVEDTMESILEHNTIEGTIFRGGSGAGCNVSNLRGQGEKLSNKGIASGPISFMKMWDSTAGAIRSGGKTRRSAKMICMNADHPDIMDFIHCKKVEEDKAKTLIASGVSPEEAYATVSFQNTNHSIRVSDEFMDAAVNKKKTLLVERNNRDNTTEVDADEVLEATAQIAWETGDPGIQFHDRMNKDNPIPNTDSINATNPCSEFSAVDNSSCNLASMNLVKYIDENDDLDIPLFEADIEVLITAMDILVDAADYPTEEIGEMTRRTRPLGLGFSNLGAYLMIRGVAYDSREGRKEAEEITRLMTYTAYRRSIELAEMLGSFADYEENRGDSISVAKRLVKSKNDECHLVIEEEMMKKGLRNSQVTLLAPTGTISFMMDCDTTGIEPLFALQTIKTLAGGGTMMIDYPCVEVAVDNLRVEYNYMDSTDEEIMNNHKDIFQTANDIPWKAHIDMMSVCQKHLNGAISKTVNMARDVSPQEIKEAYIYAWEKGIKCLAVYRDGCKGMQPMQDTSKRQEETDLVEDEHGWSPFRKQLPETRQSLTHKFNVGGLEGYLTVGVYEDGNPGEIFIRCQKQGSTMSGVLDSFATAISLALQYGVPIETLIGKFVGSKFEPAGFTQNEEIRMTSSIMDYMFRWLEITFIDEEDDSEYIEEVQPTSIIPKLSTFDGPDCKNCGSVTSRNGTCYVCSQCGETTGCS